MSNTRSFRIAAGMLSVGLAATTLTACAVGGDTPDDGPIELQFLGAEDISAFQPAIDAYEKDHPNVTIVYNAVPFAQFNSTIQARMSSKDASLDLYMVDEPRVPFLGASEYVVPYPGEASDYEGIVSDSAVEAVTWDDKVWALPLWTSSQVLYYNTTLLDAAGIPAPSADPADRLTWEELTDLAAEAQAAGAQWGFSFQQVDRYYQLQTLPESLGGGPGLTGDDMLTPDLVNDGWVDAMNWYHDTFDSGLSPRAIEPGQIPPLFTDGNLAFLVGTPVYAALLAGTENLEWGVAPMPAFADGEAYTPTDGWALGVNPYSTKQEAAWDFIRYLTLDPEGSALTIEGKPIPSANNATMDAYLAKLPELAGGHAPQISDLVSYELENTAIHRPRTTGYVAFEEIMNKTFADIRNGSDAEERLTQAQNDLSAAFGRVPEG
ncbi:MULTISPECIES: extracellular solute-binding protein [Microbacterium]|uniref:ABC transporter substrate-binding protein n=1 Tax=Microbacterium TaxID=33882 RepID=UPI00146E544E|nr:MULTISPECIES: extracellular solute-binding protein [Microbacterium]